MALQPVDEWPGVPLHIQEPDTAVLTTTHCLVVKEAHYTMICAADWMLIVPID